MMHIHVQTVIRLVVGKVLPPLIPKENEIAALLNERYTRVNEFMELARALFLTWRFSIKLFVRNIHE